MGVENNKPGQNVTNNH